MTDKEKVIFEKYCKYLHENKVSDSFLVQIIEHSGIILNISTIPKYAKRYKLSYNGVKKFRNVVKLLGVKFVIDND